MTEGAGVHFDIDDQGAPRLAGDDTSTPAVDGEPSQPESPGGLGDVVETWSPEEAQGVLQTVMNFGVFFYGPAWLCGPGDFARSAPNMARLLERVFPKATTGGAVGLGIDVAAVASDFGASIAVRRELLRKGPKKPEQVAAEFGFEQPKPATPEASAPPAAPAQPVPPGDSTAPPVSGFRFSPDVARALGAASQSGGLSDMGLMPA